MLKPFLIHAEDDVSEEDATISIPSLLTRNKFYFLFLILIHTHTKQRAIRRLHLTVLYCVLSMQ